jgi:HSP20 family protein
VGRSARRIAGPVERPVHVQDGNLFIEGQASINTPKGLRLHHAEIREPRFARAFSLSADFDNTKIDANLNDGVLKLSIPRREARPRRIEVSVG